MRSSLPAQSSIAGAPVTARRARALVVVLGLLALLLGGLTPAASADDAIVRDTTPAASRSTVRAELPGVAFRSALVAKGLTLRGVPYRYGGTSPRGFDCSGFTGYVARSLGKSLPRTAASQRAAVARVSRAQALPGDLVFFSSGGRVYHVGIYMGNNRILHASRPGHPVAVAPIWSSRVSFGRI